MPWEVVLLGLPLRASLICMDHPHFTNLFFSICPGIIPWIVPTFSPQIHLHPSLMHPFHLIHGQTCALGPLGKSLSWRHRGYISQDIPIISLSWPYHIHIIPLSYPYHIPIISLSYSYHTYPQSAFWIQLHVHLFHSIHLHPSPSGHGQAWNEPLVSHVLGWLWRIGHLVTWRISLGIPIISLSYISSILSFGFIFESSKSASFSSDSSSGPGQARVACLGTTVADRSPGDAALPQTHSSITLCPPMSNFLFPHTLLHITIRIAI